jgi:hypothetical protein
MEALNRILTNNPIISELVLQDLCKGKKRRRGRGANGMTAEQVLRAGIEAGISWLKRCSEIADLWMETA